MGVGLILFLIAYILLLPLTLINYLIVGSKDYFRSTAINIDKFGNREFRALFNQILIGANGYKFGNPNETISSVLGKNIKLKTLSRTGKILVFILTEKHCLDAINHNLN